MDKKTKLWELTKQLSDKWAENAEQHITDTIDRVLGGKQEELILKIIGMDKNYSHGWRIDHCNNRSGNSPIGIMLATKVAEKLDSIMGEINLTQEELNAIRAEARAHYIKQYKREMINRAERQAQKHAKDFAEKQVESALEGAAESVRLQLMESSIK